MFFKKGILTKTDDTVIISSVNDELCKDTIYGKVKHTGSKVVSRKSVNNHRNQNVAVFGSSGSGKTSCFVLPNLFQIVRRGESFIAADSTGKLYETVQACCRREGYHVRRLNFTNVSESDGWNLMSFLGTGSIETKSQILSNSIISSIELTPESSENLAAKSAAESFLQALMLRTWLDPTLNTNKKNIKSVFANLMAPNIEVYLDDLFDARGMDDELKPCLMPWRTFLQVGGSVLADEAISILRKVMEPLQSEQICNLLSTDGINIELLGQEKCAYFVQYPDNNSSFMPYISLFITTALNTLFDQADANFPSRKLPVPVNFVFDNFPSIGKVLNMERYIATMQSRNIRMLLSFQSLIAMKQLYTDTWQMILYNCSTWLITGCYEHETLCFVRECADIPRRTRLGENDILLLVQGRKPIKLYKFHYKKHPLCRRGKR